MKQELARLRVLAVRVGAGDRTAATELLCRLEPRVLRIVRRVLRRGSGNSLLAVRISREAQQVAATCGPDQDQVVSMVTRNICAALIDQLRAAPDCWPILRDTILG